eukprot:GHVU01157314.1.p1 GENE.GHVU01157314.1~~GHVU01157314.1.p1  ORF type:complete len:183 (-),score=13.61 GHVU01157314.1:114-662(-)
MKYENTKEAHIFRHSAEENIFSRIMLKNLSKEPTGEGDEVTVYGIPHPYHEDISTPTLELDQKSRNLTIQIETNNYAVGQPSFFDSLTLINIDQETTKEFRSTPSPPDHSAAPAEFALSPVVSGSFGKRTKLSPVAVRPIVFHSPQHHPPHPAQPSVLPSYAVYNTFKNAVLHQPMYKGIPQ